MLQVVAKEQDVWGQKISKFLSSWIWKKIKLFDGSLSRDSLHEVPDSISWDCSGRSGHGEI